MKVKKLSLAEHRTDIRANQLRSFDRQFVDSFSVKSKLYVVGGSAFEVFDSFSGIFVHHIPYFVIDGNFAFCGQSYFLLVDNKTVMFNVRYVGAIVYDLEKEEWSGYSDFYLVFKPL